MRTIVLTGLILALSLYALRDWFIPLCALVVMAAVMKHGDMPRTVLGIQGANPWNFMLLWVLLGWLHDRLRRRVRWDVSPYLAVAFLAYLVVIVIAFTRGVGDVRSIRSQDYSMDTELGFTSDMLLNPLKYLLVAALLFDGARTRRNAVLALAAIVGQAFLYALQVNKYISVGALISDEAIRFRQRIVRECGLHANDMALVLVVGFWVIVACIPLLRRMRWWWQAGGGTAALAMLTAFLMCYSRAGYIGFVVVGMLYAVLLWRPLLVIFPLIGALVCIAIPSIPSRLMEGFGVQSVAGEQVQDWDAVTAGRITNLWPPTLDKIEEAPLLGHGRLAILRTSLYDHITAQEGGCPTHPHNAYLEMLLDAGLLGLAATLALYAGCPLLALRRVRTPDPLVRAMLYTGLAAAAALLTMAMSGQTFFPREGIFLVLCAYAVMMRASRLALDTRRISASSPRRARGLSLSKAIEPTRPDSRARRPLSVEAGPHVPC